LAERNADRSRDFIELSSRGKSSPGGSDSWIGEGIEVRRSVGRIDESYQNRKRGMVLPFEPLSLTFDEIRYAVDMPQVPSSFN
jgi:hypothetical protein